MSEVTVIKTKKDIPTVIEWKGKRYVLDMKSGGSHEKMYNVRSNQTKGN